MKNLFLLLKNIGLGLLPFLAGVHYSAASGHPVLEFPDLSTLLATNEGLAATLGTLLYWLELLVRFVPTARNYSPLAFVLSVLESIVPNRAVATPATPGVAAGEPGVLEHKSIFRRIFSHDKTPPAAPGVGSLAKTLLAGPVSLAL